MYNRDTILGTDVYILTAYFFDPKTICQSNGISNRPVGVTGTGLWLQNGTDPIQDSFLIPINQSDIVSTKWVQGQCFISMGKSISIRIKSMMKFISRTSLLV
jgi:charged multivesicular body protein 7